MSEQLGEQDACCLGVRSTFCMFDPGLLCRQDIECGLFRGEAGQRREQKVRIMTHGTRGTRTGLKTAQNRQ